MPVERVKMKVEGEKSEGNVVKKEKKLKKGQASLPENKNCIVDDGSLAEVKKEKKRGKKVDTIIIEEESWAGVGEKEEKKKKKKSKIVSETLNDANGCDVKSGSDVKDSKKKTKKKKKQLADCENQVETAPSSVKEEVVVEKKQRKKVKNKSVQPENVKMEREEEAEQHVGKDKLPKKLKKGKNNILVVSSEETEEQVKGKKKKKKTEEESTEAMDGISVTKKKNKAKRKVPEHEVKLETPEGETGEVEEVKVKKKKKKEAQTIEDGNEVGTPPIQGNNKRSKATPGKEVEKDKSTKSEMVIIEEGKTEPKRKGKKEKSRKASVEVSEVEETEPKKKKRKKGSSKGEEEEPTILTCEDAEEQSGEALVKAAGDTTSKKSKRKKSSIKVDTQVENVSAKKKKIKEEVEDQHVSVCRESPQVDVVFLSEKTGNADEVTINQERRHALQMEIDEASQPRKPAKPTGFGQWSTAQFDSSDQQQKFLRLMGGFKKGFQPAAGSTGGANMALGKDGQQKLQQGLLGDFERAHSRRVDFSNRGAGLGFAAPSNKKFSIDVNTCRSVRFDD